MGEYLKIGDQCFIANISNDNKNYVVVTDMEENYKFLQKIECKNLSTIGAELQHSRNIYKMTNRYRIMAILNNKTYKKMSEKMSALNNLAMNLMILFQISGDID